MSTQQRQRPLTSLVSSMVFLLAMVLCVPSPAIAQEEERSSSFLGSITKQVLLDPTTYAPAIFSYDSAMRDWKTSQPFFQHGFVEKNPRYTITGFAYDRPIGYGDGRRQIASDALAILGTSLVNNISNRVIERLLMDRFPNHPKLVKTLGLIERVSFGAYMSYVLSGDHYRQAQLNDRRARELGYR